jgi:hypothetical protein
MPDTPREPREPKDAADRQTAGRSADARGETGTDADFLAPRAGSATGDTRMGGIPSTADTALSPSMSGSSDITSDGPIDRERPTRDAGEEPSSAGSAPTQRPRDERDAPERGRDDGPLESLGKAVSAPVIDAANEDEGEKPA